MRNALFAIALVACSSSSNPDDATNADNGAAGGDVTVTVQEALAGIDTMFQFDPTLKPDAGPDENAASIETQVKNSAPCAKLTRTGTSIQIDYGSGCTVGGVNISGSVTLSLSRSGPPGPGGTTTLTLTFTNFSVDSRTFTGTASFATTNGSTFTVALDLTASTKAIKGTLTVTGSPGSFTIDGPLTVTESGTTSNVVFKGVVYQPGQCYPNAGTVTITKGSLPQTTITFSAATATTGTVQVTTGKATGSEQLPKYGSCPS
jgi:hypothetical protein